MRPEDFAQAARALLRAPEQSFRDEPFKTVLKRLMERAGAEDLSRCEIQGNAFDTICVTTGCCDFIFVLKRLNMRTATSPAKQFTLFAIVLKRNNAAVA